jgi:hypothetical protein
MRTKFHSRGGQSRSYSSGIGTGTFSSTRPESVKRNRGFGKLWKATTFRRMSDL